jgi:hypothetical protein
VNLNLPLDFERLPEFWQLGEALRVRKNPALADSIVNEQAIVLWVRLWVVLGYLARHTNRPGWLNAAGERQLNGAFTQFGDDCPPVQVLEGNLLRKGDDGWYCDLFTQHNKHLAGDHVPKEMRGNIRSRLNAAKNNIAATAMQQAQLLPPEIFKRRDGTPMPQREIDRSTVLILTLDRCLKAPARLTSSYTEGLMADACAVVCAVTPEALQEFYYWLAERREHPATPKTAEEVLKDWDRIYKASQL